MQTSRSRWILKLFRKAAALGVMARLLVIPQLLPGAPNHAATSARLADSGRQTLRTTTTATTFTGQPVTPERRAVVNFQKLAADPAKRANTQSPKVIPAPGREPMPSDFAETTGFDRKAEEAPPPTPSTAANAATLVASFAALDNGQAIPPDTQGAAGPNHLMVMLNTEVRIQDRSGTPLKAPGSPPYSLDATLDDFWGGLGKPATFDPKILYDPYSHRWFCCAMADKRSAKSAILLGQSDTDDPTGDWTLYRFDADATDQFWADYPSIGFNRNWVVVSVNMFANPQDGPFQRVEVYVFGRGADGRVQGPHFRFEVSEGFTLAPAVTLDPAQETLYLLQTRLENALRLSTITGGPTSPTLNYGVFTIPGRTGWRRSAGDNFLPQLGTNKLVDAGDHRVQNVVYRNGSLWTTHTVFAEVNFTTSAMAQWWQLDPDTGALLQFGRIGDGVRHHAYPSIAVNARNDVLIGFSTFSAGAYVGAGYSFRTAADPPDTMQRVQTLKAGEASYYRTDLKGRNRWGDYSASVTDPVNDLHFWTIQEYAALPKYQQSRWGTWWGRIAPGGDTVPPVVSITGPVAGQAVPALALVTGQVTDNLDLLSTVTLSIRVPADGGHPERWWNGAAWQNTPRSLAATVTGTNWSWSASNTVPLPCGGVCVLTATATDTADNAASASITVLADSTPPVLSITSHTNHQVVAALNRVSGIVTDDDGAFAEVALSVRGFDRWGYSFGWWNGSAFQPTFASLPCDLGGAGGNGQRVAWSIAPSVTLPCPAPGDAYELTAWSSCTNSASVTVHVQSTVISGTPGTDGPVYALAEQPDGRFLAGGGFTSLSTALGSWARHSVGRVLPAGAVDSFFNAAIEPDSLNGDDISCLAVQPDGKVLLGGEYFTFGWSQQPYIARLHSDGWLDWGFRNYQIDGPVRALAVQPDGKIIVASEYHSQRIRRLLADGELDASFTPSANGPVNCVAAQADGKILVGGLFTTLNGQPRQYLGRLHPNGSLDTATQTNNLAANGEVHTLVVQPDGKIIVGGDFTSIGGQNHNRLARIEPDGTVEWWFNTGVGSNGRVETIALQADGRLIVGGGFSQLHGEPREGLGRLMSDGSLDSSFDSSVWNTYGTIHALALQADGTLIVGGSFDEWSSWGNLRRLASIGRAPQCFNRGGNRITWLRGGASPEVWRTTFEYSTNSTAWLPLGAGTRIAGGWEIAGVSAPAEANLRARGWTTGGRGNGSAWFVEALIAPPIITLQPLSQTRCPGPGQGVSFTVSAMGNGPFTYQWRKNGVNLADGPLDGGYVQGATTPTLELSALSAAATGAYDVVVANNLGSAVSEAATLTVAARPVFLAHPESETRQVGGNVSLGVQVDSAVQVTYQWRRAASPLAGQTNVSLTLTNLQSADAGPYDVVVANTCSGGAVTSAVAVLSVNLALADEFDPHLQQYVLTLAPQADGRLIVGGYRGLLGADNLAIVTRLGQDGLPEAGFAADLDGYPLSLAVQEDGGLWLGGGIWPPGSTTNMLVRLGAGGSLETALALGGHANHPPGIYCLARQADGKLLVGGVFGALGGSARQSLARLNVDGTIDESFDARVEVGAATVAALAVQPDGKILVGGSFRQLAGQNCVNLGRLLPNGGFDSSFLNPNTDHDNLVRCLVVQPDGKILVGGFLRVARTNLLRLQADGQLDPDFDPVVTGHLPSYWEGVTQLALQTDGEILVAGQFLSVGGLPRTHLARLHPDGTPDLAFAPNLDDPVNAVALEVGGGVLVGGSFVTIAGQTRFSVARLVNPDRATNDLTLTTSTLTWRRGGSTPEVWRATFEASADGLNWASLGAGTRIAGGWELTGLSLSPASRVRARGFVGSGGGSDYFVEAQAGAASAPRLVDASIGAGGFQVRFVGEIGRRYHVEYRNGLTSGDWTELEQRLGAGAMETVTDSSGFTGQRFYRLRIVSLP